MKIELDAPSGVNLSVYDKNRNLVAVSNNAGYFTASGSNQQPYTLDMITTVFCLGPCVNIENTDGWSERYYIQIDADAGTSYDCFMILRSIS